MTPRAVTTMLERFAEQDPDPRCELTFTNPYTLLVAVVLSAQATDVGVNKATAALFAEIDTPAKMLALGEARLKDAVKSINLYPTKARNILALSQRLVDDWKGEVPADRDALESLPGVGRKSANVVLNVAFGQPTLAVDTHVFRVAHRLGLAEGSTPRAVEDVLNRVIPEDQRRNASHWLVLHGRYICRARAPACPTCFLRDLCAFFQDAPGGVDAT